MKFLKIVQFLLIVAIILVCSIAAQDKVKVNTREVEITDKTPYLQPPPSVWPYYFNIVSEPKVLVPGPARVKILFSPNTNCKDVKFSLLHTEKLEYSGPDVWNIPAAIGDTQVFVMDVTIPAKDTSGFNFEIENCGNKQHGFHYFIAEDSIVHTSPMNLSRAAREIERAARKRPLNSSRRLYFERPESKPTNQSYVGIVDESGLVIEIPADSFEAWEKRARDTATERKIDSLEMEIRSVRVRCPHLTLGSKSQLLLR